MKQDIKNLTFRELEQYIVAIGGKPFHARQIFQWIYIRNILDFDSMTDLNKDLRKKLSADYTAGINRPVNTVKAPDNTEKYLFRLQDTNFIESVLIPAKNRLTLCISSQAGCKYKCAFCASGINGFIRDLTAAEIVGQVLFMTAVLKKHITNYVFMGMGEPLDNCDNVIKAMRIMTDQYGMNASVRNITVSTCGIVPGIVKLMNSGLKVNLSVSLHAAGDVLRNRIMPVNKKYPLKELLGAGREYFKNTGRQVTLEYILFKGINDSADDARSLAITAKRLNSKINIILYNPVQGLDYRRPSDSEAAMFETQVRRSGAKVTLRDSKGTDITAACGQLYLIKKK